MTKEVKKLRFDDWTIDKSKTSLIHEITLCMLHYQSRSFYNRNTYITREINDKNS